MKGMIYALRLLERLKLLKIISENEFLFRVSDMIAVLRRTHGPADDQVSSSSFKIHVFFRILKMYMPLLILCIGALFPTSLRAAHL